MHYVRKVLHHKIMKFVLPGSSLGSAAGLFCHVKLIEHKRVQISGHYYASYCQSLKPDFLPVLETPDEH